MTAEPERRIHFDDIAKIDERWVTAEGELTVDCSRVGQIDGFLVGILLSLPRSTVLHFVDGESEVFEALAMMAGGRDWRFAGGQGFSRIPIRVKPAALDGEWNVHLSDQADWSGWMRNQEAVSWIGRLHGRRIWVDMVDIGHLRSVIIGWLLSLRQELGEVPIRLVNVDPRANSVLQQMRLSSVFEINGSHGAAQEDASAARQVMDR